MKYIIIMMLVILTSCTKTVKNYNLKFEVKHSLIDTYDEIISDDTLGIFDGILTPLYYTVKLGSSEFGDFIRIDTIFNRTVNFSTYAVSGDVVSYYLSMGNGYDYSSIKCTVFGSQILIDEQFDLISSSQLSLQNIELIDGVYYVKFHYEIP